jgi:hypothetical protein
MVRLAAGESRRAFFDEGLHALLEVLCALRLMNGEALEALGSLGRRLPSLHHGSLG